jgi:hypothetical protein
MRIKRLASFTQLAALCAPREGGDFLFRGVPDRRFGLVPALGRRVPGHGGRQLGYDAADAERLLGDLRRMAFPYAGEVSPADGLAWFALGRQHGLPTPLLDWSQSPLVAAWFACAYGSAAPGRTAALYRVPRPPRADTLEAARAAGTPTMYVPEHVAPRMTAQRTVYTFHVDSHAAWEPAGLVRYDIPARARATLAAALTQAGMSVEVLFPGMDGVVQALEAKYRRTFAAATPARRRADAHVPEQAADSAAGHVEAHATAPASVAEASAAMPPADSTEKRPMIEQFAAAFERAAFGPKIGGR